MTIWILTVLLLASVAALGYRQGAIRVAFSFVGIIIAALLAVPLGNLIQPLLKIFGLKNPVLAYLLAPVVVFIMISAIFKVAAVTAHHKADVFYKYKAGDLRLALWERLNARLGACLGLANGVIYLILLSVMIFPISYATHQVASSDSDPRWMRIFNKLGADMQNTGFSKVARALDGRTTWYQAADLAGVLYHNSLLEARVARYPAFLGLSERTEFKDIGADHNFAEMRDRKEPIMDILNHEKVRPILENPDLLNTIWKTVVPDLKDFTAYLESGRSPKYDPELILGRWSFDVNQAMVTIRRAKPNMSSKEAQTLKRWLAAAFGSTSMVAMTDQQVLLKNLPSVRQPSPNPAAAAPATGTQNLNGTWRAADGQYEITFSGGAPVKASIENDRLRMNYEGTDLAFIREI